MNQTNEPSTPSTERVSTAMQDIFKIDESEIEVDNRTELEKKLWEAYGSCWSNKRLQDDEYPKEEICDKCKGCGQFQFEGEIKECFQDRVEGACYHRYFSYEGFGMEVEAILL